MSTENIVLFGMGNPLLDISVELQDDALLTKYDLKLDSAVLAEDKHQSLYTDLVNGTPAPQYIAGGATQNSIRVAQWMLQSPGKTAFVGCIGKDSFGKQLSDCATSDGVLVHYMMDETTPTGTCAVLVKDGERSLCANLAAANNFKQSHLESAESKALYEAAKFYYIAGFFLTVSVESLQIVGDHAVAENKPFALNLSAPFIIDFFGDQVATAIEYADYLFCNESEAAAYGKKHSIGNDGEDLQAVALAIAALPKKNSKRTRTVIFTQGSKSTIVCQDGAVVEYAVVPLEKEKLVDTNGAGDAFVGGFLSQMVQDKGMEDAVKAGHWAAREIIQQSGTQLPATCDYKN
jgi:adenosine kinase